MAATIDMVALRRHFHEHPELSMQEHQTAAFVAERLRALGVDEVREAIGETGVVGIIRGAGPKTVLLRADMDALPMQELGESSYRSRNSGVMHACGHDAHTAMLLGATERLLAARADLQGTVVLCFQPGEEGHAGAKRMIADGLLREPRVDAAFALHCYSAIDVGTIATRPGPLLACSDKFELDVIGMGGHGAIPHTAIDPVVIACYVVTALQTLVSREIAPKDPAVVTIGSIQAGTAQNVIPDMARMKGTVRAFDHAVRMSMKDRIERLAAGITGAMRARSELRYNFSYPPTVNDARAVALVQEVAATIPAITRIDIPADMIMVAEDFSFILDEVPGAMIMLGTRSGASTAFPQHSARYDIDERALPIGADLLARVATEYLNASARQ